MMKSADFAGTQHEFRKKLIQNIGTERTDAFYKSWLDNHFTRTDVDSMKAWGFNSVRVAMHYKWLTLPIEEEPVLGQDTWLEEGFAELGAFLNGYDIKFVRRGGASVATIPSDDLDARHRAERGRGHARTEPGGSAGSFYTIVVTLDEPDDELRWGMTARLDFGEEQ